MPDTTAHLALPFIMASQAQKHVTHNEALRLLDGIVQLSVLDRDLTDPPASPAEGARYIPAGGATGAWAGWDGNVAYWVDGAWLRLIPAAGWLCWVQDEDRLLAWSGSAWDVVGGGGDAAFDTLGVGGASGDPINRLSVNSPATLLNNAGDDHQLKINKNAAGDTASLLFQTGWSGRAEMGLAGEDDFSFKVSPDGSDWETAITIDAATGIPDLNAGTTVDGHAALHRGNLTGPVSQSGGVPTGAVVESGENSNGRYVRFADGTQICHHRLETSTDAAVTWTYPAAFASGSTPAGFVTAMVGGIARMATTGSIFTSSMTVNIMSTSGVRAAANAAVTVIGRWF